MGHISRRAFLGASVAAVSTLGGPAWAQTAAQCGYAGFPAGAKFDCSAAHNFQMYLKYRTVLGLTGLVSAINVKGQLGYYPSGTLLLFPYVKPGAQGAGIPLGSLPGGGKRSVITKVGLPYDEYFLRYILNAPLTGFVGFSLDAPYDKMIPWMDATTLAPENASTFDRQQGLRPWRTNVSKLGADGSQEVGIEWTSHNLNGQWFAGSHWIPASDTCDGNAWRRLIISLLRRASAATVC